MSTATHLNSTIPGQVNRVVTYVHVQDVDASVVFYALLGFAPENVMKDGQGRAFWGLVKSGGGEMMFARADGAIDAGQQAVLFYMYSADVAGLRRHLIASGVREAGGAGAGSDGRGRGAVHAITRPGYMPAGELRVIDPDGYVILIGQLS